jgi:DNA-binding SARP family transcriptional activator
VKPAPAARVGLLDGFTLELGECDSDVVDLLPRGVQRLVAYLSLSRRSARTAIAGHLWPDVPEDHAHGSLRSALWRLQKTAPGLLHVWGDTLSLAEGVEVDVRDLIAWARRVSDSHAGIDDLTSTPERLHGELLPGWYDDWVLLERERLRQLRMYALEDLAQRLADAGRYGEAVQSALAAIRAEPLRESAHRTLIRVHLAEGNLREAARAYDCFRAVLADELGVLPSRRMSELVSNLPPPPWSPRLLRTSGELAGRPER